MRHKNTQISHRQSQKRSRATQGRSAYIHSYVQLMRSRKQLRSPDIKVTAAAFNFYLLYVQ
jgi:hypothetical protein